MDPNIHEVNRTEHHYLPTCPCEACRLERLRTGRNTSTEASASRIVVMSSEAAELLFGFPRSSRGASAEEEAAKSTNESEK